MLTAALLSIVCAALVGLALERSIRSTMLAVDDVATQSRGIVRENWSSPDARIVQLVKRQTLPAGVRIMVLPSRPSGPPFGTPGTAPPAEGALGRPPGPPPERSLASAFGLRPRFVWLHKGAVIVGPETPLARQFQIALAAFGLAVIVSLAISWAVGRWITQQALGPLTTVTHELRRFAAGDFAPSVLETNDRTELGDLIAAYNGAAAQVVAAFSERERTAQHLRLILGEAGHEMRTPLTVISAHLEVLDRGGGQDVTIPAQALQALRGETRRLRELVERVMALARMEGSDRSGAEILDVVEVARDAIAHVTSAGPGNVRLTHPADDAVVFGQPWELQEAIGNLVDNAVRYGANTPVDVSIELVDERVVLRVSDGGPGVSEDDRAQLFRHFFRGEHAVGTTGSGLGLAIVARAATRLGGAVELERGEPGRTTFRLTIPTYRPQVARRQEKGEPFPVAANRT
jgi:signal transduction histidine kinase